MKNHVIINKEECVGIKCAFCVSVCSNNAIYIDSIAHIDSEKCSGCMRCIKNICPNYAISAKQGVDQL